ncbi:MAG: phosphatidylserine decarboxylase [Bacteriovoracaceae bacterium]|jgi:phosphatidylserine decarboxylase
MSQAFEITIHNRNTGNKEIEKVYGHKAVEFAYNTFLGKILAPIVASRTVSKLYGKTQDSLKSGKKVPQFIKDFSIDLDIYEKGSFKTEKIENSYKSFNEFFIRTFKKGKRGFVTEPNRMGACAEARYFGYDAITDDLKVPVKGSMLKAIDLIGNSDLAKDFVGGPLMIARLCPVDYHRYHYPDNGKTVKSYQIPGDFHSVNPIALKFRGDIFIKNERRVSILETENFGKLAYIEVGATCVGKIIQSFNEDNSFKKGDEKGYFLFGGSTVIILGEPGKWKPSSDILENTKLGVETYLHLGDEVAIV